MSLAQKDSVSTNSDKADKTVFFLLTSFEEFKMFMPHIANVWVSWHSTYSCRFWYIVAVQDWFTSFQNNFLSLTFHNVKDNIMFRITMSLKASRAWECSSFQHLSHIGKILWWLLETHANSWLADSTELQISS